MRVVIIVGTVTVATLFLLFAGLGIWDAGRRVGRKDRLSHLGLTPGASQRYTAAVQIMERLDGRSDLTGVLAGDTLSTETQAMVGSWVSAHRKESQPG